MVGKGETRIFLQCYTKCCKLQNLAPLNIVTPTANGKNLDFCVDRIKYQEWGPILNAICWDLSLHSIAIRCRQQVKTVLEHIDCERLAKTVNKRAVILTNFMLRNLVAAIAQLLSQTALLKTLILEGLPLKIPYLNPLREGLIDNSSLQHLHLPRCLIGDAGCMAICKAVQCLPNLLTLDLAGCDLTVAGATCIADLLKYQKIHRYSENWVHTLRYRLPELDNMSGLRRISLCGNTQLGDAGVIKLIETLEDDLWIKALDVQNCGITEQSAQRALQMLQSNTTIIILDMRQNPDVSSESLTKIRNGLRHNERGTEEFSWLSVNANGVSLDGRSVKSGASRNNSSKDRFAQNKTGAIKTNAVKKEKDYTEMLEEQLQEEISHRQQLEEMNLQLVEQMKQLKQQQIRLWTTNPPHDGFRANDQSSGSEQSVQNSCRSSAFSSSSGCSSSVPIDQSTLSYIQQAFKDIYSFIKNNQCQGQCRENNRPEAARENDRPEARVIEEDTAIAVEMIHNAPDIAPKKAQSSPFNKLDVKMNNNSKSAHMLCDTQHKEMEMKPEMIERQMGDSKNAHAEQQLIYEELIMAKTKTYKNNKVYEISPSSSTVTSSSDTLVCSELERTQCFAAPNPIDAFYSSSDDDNS